MVFILDVTNAPEFCQKLSYWTEYTNNQFKFVDAEEIREKYPCLAIEYFEHAFLSPPLPDYIDAQTSLNCTKQRISKVFQNFKLYL